MKHNRCLRICLLCGYALFLSGCISVYRNYTDAWPGKKQVPALGSVRLESVIIDRREDRDSLEDEIRDMAPLLFLSAGFPDGGDNADYAAEIRLRERSFIQGWKTTNSLAVELCIFKNGSGERGFPLAAGRVILQGDASLASSAVLSRMMKKAMKEAAAALLLAEAR